MASNKIPTSRIHLPKIFQFAFVTIFLSACVAIDPQVDGTEPLDHSSFDLMLRKYVDEEGFVDYKRWQQNRKDLSAYLENLTTNPPNDKRWSREEKLAYWINLYNAFTIDLILEYYPVKSIKDIGSSIQVPFVNTPWDIKLIVIGKEKYDLNNIEHNILRKIFNEPRIHFAINCASYSCPKLRREAFTAEKLEEQLEEQAREFLNDPKRNNITEEKAEVSKIFQWFGGDFKKETSLAEFINPYVPATLTKATDITFMDYDWSLNDQSDF